MLFSTSTAVNQGRHWRIFVLKAIVFAVVLWFVGSTLRAALADLERADWRFDGPTVVLCGLFYIAGLAPAGICWWWLLKRLGQAIPPLPAIKAYFVGHLGKYAPGKAMVVILRVGLARSAGADAALATIAVVIETLMMMACGAAIAFVLVAVLVPHDWKLWLAAGLAIATGGPTLPPLLNRLLRRLQAQRQKAAELDTPEEAVAEAPELAAEPPVPPAAAAIDWPVVAVGWLGMAALWLLLGLSLAVLLVGLSEGSGLGARQYLIAVAAVALATVAGFLSLLPGGLIVRELILLDLLAPQVGEATALVAAVLLRLIWLASELLAAGGLYLLGGLYSKSSSARGQADNGSSSPRIRNS